MSSNETTPFHLQRRSTHSSGRLVLCSLCSLFAFPGMQWVQWLAVREQKRVLHDVGNKLLAISAEKRTKQSLFIELFVCDDCFKL